MKTGEFKGIYRDLAQIELKMDGLTNVKMPEIPYGSEIRIIIETHKTDFLNGLDGIVWATLYSDQAEIIQGSLLAQNIKSTIKKKKLERFEWFLLEVSLPSSVERAVNFIWKSKEGLQLKPDWHYPLHSKNISFEKWTK